MSMLPAAALLSAILAQNAAAQPPAPALRDAQQLYRDGQVEKALAIIKTEELRQPTNPDVPHLLGYYYFDLAQKITGSDAGKLQYILLGIEAEDRALAIQPRMFEAITFKGLLLRMQVSLTTDANEQKRLLDEANRLRDIMLEMQRQRVGDVGPGVPPPPPAADDQVASQIKLFGEPFTATAARLQPVRLACADCPTITQDSRVQGVVILEALLDQAGKLANARIIRSSPMLDEAALTVVRDWEYTPPTLANGQHASTIITVTVVFRSQ